VTALLFLACFLVHASAKQPKWAGLRLCIQRAGTGIVIVEGSYVGTYVSWAPVFCVADLTETSIF
jgi:hypothetical protein